jgi:hypothetical protein
LITYTKPIVFILIALATTACWSPKKARKIFAEQKELGPFDVLIVPGIPHNGDTWDDVMKYRVHWAKYLYEQGLAKNIIFSGSAVYTPYYEGEVMRRYAVALGLPKEHMFAETNAEHSVENVYYSVLMGKSMGYSSFALATDPYQNYFMKKVYKREIDFLYYLPFDYEIMEGLNMTEPDIELEQCKKNNFVPLPEREGTIKRWRGTTGRRVDFDEMKE